jgi:16S rRNA (adenine1518-N6/adenine1519-N6)-dimethyltransferase
VPTRSTGSSWRRSRPRAPSAGEVPEGAAAVAATLARLGVSPSRRWGQSFLTDPFVADAEAALVEVAPGRPVLEIGGGLGLLTSALLRRGYRPLTVIEKDPRLARYLGRTFGDRIELVEGDALTVDLPTVDAVAGNLPYSVATPILLRLFERRVPRIVFLLQAEVAARLAAGPGERGYGRLSLIARLYGEVELFREVGRGAFFPPPEVASRIGVHTARPGALPVPSVPTFERAVRALFTGRRKQLSNLLPRLAPSRGAAQGLAQRAGWPADWARLRPEDLPPEAYFRLATVLESGPEAGPDR